MLPESGGVGRRGFLAALAAGAASAGLLGASRDGDRRATRDCHDRTVVEIRPPGTAGDWTVDRRLFGKFLEHNGRDAYPGIYADHVTNGSFEVWNRSGPRTAALYDVATYDGVAYPWEPVDGDGAEYRQVTGGVHGRGLDRALDTSATVPDAHRPQPGGIDAPRFQRVAVAGTAGLRQRTALPDRRTDEYDLSVSVRGAGIGRLTARIEGADGTVLASGRVPVTGTWERRSLTLESSGRSDGRYRGSPFGECALSFRVAGDGHVDLDWVELLAGDAVEGMFNPTTLRYLREFSVTTLRWPGGNFASQYHWRDGVGPRDERPVVPNANWGGLERNALGSNEFLRFCELADVEPLFCVGAWSGIGPGEAANWVRYLNDDPSTELGGLRAAHGHPEPWDVTEWQVGNEVWGPWQIGHTDAETYARQFREYADAMTAADPSISVTATGIDPTYADFDGGAYGTGGGRGAPRWNDVLFETAGGRIDGLDVHRYTTGIRNPVGRQAWLWLEDADPVDYNRALVAYPTRYEQVLADLAATAAAAGHADTEVVLGEWNLQPRVDDGWPRADYRTMAHAAATASAFNAFVRQGEHVRGAYMRDNTLFYRAYPHDMRPINPANHVQRLYAEPFEDDDWHRRPVALSGPSFTIPATGSRIERTPGVPYVDAVCLERAGDDAPSLLVYLVNRDLRCSRGVDVVLPGADAETGEEPVRTTGDSHRAGGGDVDAAEDSARERRESGGAVEASLVLPADDPFARQTAWSGRDGFELRERAFTRDADGIVGLTLPPSGVARLSVGRG
ncbi:hypothetical protein BRC83_07465 [Halobacteriales archaeon QS_1_68_17]|nr:MAG: hypothetical protein BRC83_07465 [Halobacteriales archaeon QS_1_68_17]